MNAESARPRPADSATATRSLLEQVRAALDDLGPFATGTEAADAHRHVLRLVSAALDLHVERADPARPLPTVWMSPTRKFLGDSPDTVYTTFPVSAEHDYELEIRSGNAAYVGAVVYARDEPDGPVRVSSSLVDTDMSWHGESATIAVGSAAGPHGLATDGGSFWLMLREYFAGPDHRPARLALRRTDGDSPDGPPDPAALAAGIEHAGRWIRGQVQADLALDALMPVAQGMPETGETPEVPAELISRFFPTPDISYQGCRFSLGIDQRLVIRFVPPPCRLWSVTVTTPWSESLEQRRTPASITSARASVDDDGAVTIVVSDDDPGVENWIPLRGYPRAQVAYRAVLAESAPEQASFVIH